MNEQELLDAIRALEEKAAGEPFTRDQKDAWNELNEKLDEFRARRDRVRTLADDPRSREMIFDEERGTGLPTGDLRSRALAANERAVFLPERSREHMDHELREDDDPEARLARYVIETSKRDYLRAFSRWVNDPVSGPHTWSPQEREAVRGVKYLERSMNLTGAQGGFLVPYELDPAILIASAGYVDPMRAVARVATTAQNEKRFVTSLGVTSNWYAEEAEVTDNAPALLQPAIVCKKAMAFVPVSFELFEDSDIAQQIGAVFADSKAVEEARVFTTGNGTTEPKGIITALVAAGGSIVIATGTNVLAQGDLYANQAALPPRWRPNAKWMMNLSILNGYRQLPQATGLNYSIVNDDGPIPKALGWEIRENSAMDGTLTGAAADYLVLSGDFKQYAIVDRIGTSLEFIPHLFGANRRPTGQRGFLMHWRVGADALIPDAFRLSNFST
ncbi:MAG: phage major capsid protein [Actinomycetota bacterium]|nr:phage major capsid protein [Actinomycetota bacterium]